MLAHSRTAGVTRVRKGAFETKGRLTTPGEEPLWFRTLVTPQSRCDRRIVPKLVRNLLTLIRTRVTPNRVVHRTLMTHPNRIQIAF